MSLNGCFRAHALSRPVTLLLRNQALTVRQARLVQAPGRLRLPDPHQHRLASTGEHSLLWLHTLARLLRA